jgi:hypothetical protein
MRLVTMNVTDLSDFTPFNLIGTYQQYGGACCQHFQSKRIFTVKMEAAGSYETFIYNYKTTWKYSSL